MNEKDLNIEYICDKTLLNKDDELVPIILSLIQESYKAGLCQTEFDNTMNLIEENQELKQKYENAVADYETTMAEKNELKKHLEVPETCNLKTLEDYKSYYEDTTREQILADTYIEYCAYVNLAHGYSKLKKQLEEINKMIEKCGFVNIQQVVLNYCGLLVQQKGFINYLEDLIKQNETVVEVSKYGLPKNCSKLLIDFYKIILSKYKEITGVKDE